MLENQLNIDFENCSDTELRAWFRQSVPIVKQFVKAAKRFCALKQRSCESCKIKAECNQHNQGKEDRTCLILEPLISSRYEGTGYREKNMGLLIKELGGNKIIDHKDTGNSSDDPEKPNKLDRSSLRAIDKVRSEEIFTLYENCFTIFTKREWQVITLKIQHGMIYRKIGKMLSIAPSTVSDTFRRAKKKMERFYLKKRESRNGYT